MSLEHEKVQDAQTYAQAYSDRFPIYRSKGQRSKSLPYQSVNGTSHTELTETSPVVAPGVTPTRGHRPPIGGLR